MTEDSIWNHIASHSPPQEIAEIERYIGIKIISENQVTNEFYFWLNYCNLQYHSGRIYGVR